MEATDPNFSGSTGFYPPKPILVEAQGNNVVKSLMSLLIYALLFYFLFEKNIAYIAAVLLVLLIHEFGHFFAMKFFHYKDLKLFIVPLLGAYVSGKKQNVSQKQMTVIILSGPLPGLFIGFALYFVNKSMPNETVKMLANVFIFLNLFNLLPIYPLDGGRLLENLFIRNNYGIRLVFTILSIMFLLIVIVLTGSLLMLIIPVMMIIELYNEIRNQKIRDYLDQEKINYKSEYALLPDKSYWLIRDCIIFSFQKKYAVVQAGVYEYSILESVLMQHVIGILKADFKDDLSVLSKVMVLLFYVFCLVGLPLISYILFF
jgi:Zn-dependent protease